MQIEEAVLKTAHDRYFKAIMELDYISHEFFEKHLPSALLEQLDLKTLNLIKDSFIRDSLKRKEADALFAVKKTDGSEAFIYLLFEHMSTQSEDLPFRMHQYVIDIMDGYKRKHKTKKVPFVYPIVLYTGAKPYTKLLDFFDMFMDQDKDLARQYLLQPLNIIDLTHTDDETIKERYDWLQLAAFLSKAIQQKNVMEKLESIMTIARQLDQQDALLYVILSISYLFHKGAIDDQEAYNKVVDNIYLKSEEGDAMRTLAEYLREDGIKAGILLGREEGKLEGKQEGLKEKERETVQKMYLNGAPIDMIVKLLEIDQEKVKQYISLITKN